MDKAYFIAKELLMTERTYKKDLEIINLVKCTDCMCTVQGLYDKSAQTRKVSHTSKNKDFDMIFSLLIGKTI